MLCEDHDAGVTGCLILHARANERCLRPQERHCLALHVRTHERAVRVIVFEEGDHGRRDGKDLARAHVHVIDLVAAVQARFLMEARRDALIDKPLVLIERLVGLGDDEIVLFVRREIAHLVRDLVRFLIDAAIRRLHETELVHARIRRERADEADVRTFRGLDRTHAAIMRVMDVTHLETRALAR